MNGMLRRVSERKVEGSGVDRCPMAKARAKASRKSDESKQKETQGNVRLKVQ